MKKLRYLIPIGPIVALTMGGSPFAFASSSTDLSGTAAIGLANYTDLGEAPANATMNVTVFLKLHNQAQLQQDIDSHKKLTPSEFHANFSPSNTSYQAVENQLQHAGLTVIGTASNNMAIDVQGTVSQFESLLGTDIHQYKDASGSTFLANPTDYKVSGSLAAHLAGTVGVDELANPQPLLVSTNNLTLNAPSANMQQSPSAQFFAGIKSANIQKAYDFTPVYDQGIDGSGQTIAIVDAYGSPTISSDLQTYNQTVEQGAYGANDPLNLTIMEPPGLNTVAKNNPQKSLLAAAWAGEVSMDVELSHAAAPGAKILLVTTPNAGSDLYMGVNQVVDKDLANQMSLSFGSPEQYTPAAERTALNQIFEQAAAQGINVFVSAGDAGDFTQPPYDLAQPAVSFPAADPNVISVGGTALFTNSDDTYNSELLWGDTFTSITSASGVTGPGFFYAGTGGGTSTVYAKPSWQTGVTGLGSTTMRQVPDVSYDADPFTGFALVVNGQVQDGWGGTSDAAPQWAAICALANQAYQNKTGDSLPFVNPILYADGYKYNAFHDVQSGTLSGIKLTDSSGNVYSLTMGKDTSLQAGPGWDDATGLGTPDVANVVNELANSGSK